MADAKITDDLKKSGPAWESFQQNRYGDLHRALGVVVSNPGIISLMTLDPLDPATTIDTLKTQQASNARADFLLAADRKGIVFARTDKPLGYSADLSSVPTIAGALAGEGTQGIWLSGGKLYHVVAEPVVEGGSRVVGAIGAAFQINDDVARNLKSLMNTEVLFLADEAKPSERPVPSVAATTMQDTTRAVVEAVRQTAGLEDAVFRQGKTIGPLPLEVSGDTYLGVLPSDPLLHRPARGRRGGPAKPRKGAVGLPADPEHAGAGGPAGAPRSPSSSPSCWRGASPVPWTGSCARPRKSASETWTRWTCRWSPKTRSASSPAPSARCSRS